MASVISEAKSAESKSIVRPLLLSHGTLMCRNMADSRRFYEEFLGLEVVRHAKPAMMLRLKSAMYVVCVCRGEHLPNQHVLTHWGVNVASREEVERAHADAQRLKEKYGIRKLTKLKDQHGAYAFYLQDLDNKLVGDPARRAHHRRVLRRRRQVRHERACHRQRRIP
jgi:catechol 2,3-dioxygenase-like lactoylglutathione lyase family enzyme